MSAEAQSLFHQANLLLSDGRPADAVPLYHEALALSPGHPECLANLGVALAELGRLDEAIGWYNAALEARPIYAEAYYNRGNAHRYAKRYPQALADYEAAVRISSRFEQAWVNRGLTLMRLGRGIDAVVSYREALAIRPQYAEAMNNLGLALQVLGYADDAIDHFNEAMQLKMDYGAARSNRAQAWLVKGDFERGWPEYEWRWAVAPPLPDRGLPMWDGAALNGRSVLVRHEQGLGDTIMFVRYAPLVQARGGRVVLECPARMHPLLRGVAGVDAFISREDEGHGCDIQMPMLSLPGIFRTEFRSIPAPGRYLYPDSDRVARWREMLPGGRPRIGICWQGNPDFPEDAFRSIPLSEFAPLADMPGVVLVSLQKGHGAEQAAEFRQQHGLHELPDDLDADGAFLDTAAVMMSLDLIVTSDTSIAHLAGALGRPVWIALGIGAEWRWLRDRDDSPWYPTARLFRQRAIDDWNGVFRRIAKSLADGIQ